MTAICVFLSYCRRDLNYARMLHDRLEAADIIVWWDQEQIPGDDWLERVDAWLHEAHAIVVIVSQHSATSASVKNEVLLAQDAQQTVIPIVLEKTRGGLWVLIRSLQWIDASDGRDPLPELLAVLRLQQRLNSPAPDTFGEKSMIVLPTPPPPSITKAHITITLPGDALDFIKHEQIAFIRLLARLTNLRPDQIRIVRIEAGSVIVTLELPESTARWLADMYEYERQAVPAELCTYGSAPGTLADIDKQRASLIDLLDIQEVRDLRVLPAPDASPEISSRASDAPSQPLIPASLPEPAQPAPPGVAERFKAWLQGWRSLSFAGALATVLLVIVLIAILRTSALPPGPPGGGVAERAPVGVVAEVRGTLELQGAGWNAFVPVSTGATLRSGDQVRLAPGAQARVVCADARVVELREGTSPNPCRSQNGWLFDIAETPWANAVLSADDARIPQVVAPRATALLTTTPTIRWSAVEGAESYTVILRREGEEVWRVTVRGTTMLAYPADQPPLERGPIYRFVVSADDGPRENAQGAGVVVLTEQEAQEVAAEVRRLEQLAVDDATRRLVLANLYASRGLYADALAALEGLPSSPAQPAPLQLLGDMYLAIGLPALAVAPYTQAHDAAVQIGDRLAQAQANRMLGMVYSRLGGSENRKRAVEHYRQALQFYEEVGDESAQKELRQLLSALE